jgi:hypothetical protein
VWFQFSKWRWSNTQWRRYLIWVPLPVIAIALAAFFLKKQWRNIRHPRAEHRRDDRPGRDSEFYAVERVLADRGLDRLSGESLGSWINRIRPQANNPDGLRELAGLHMRYRFDPAGLDSQERAALRQSAQDYLREQKRQR